MTTIRIVSKEERQAAYDKVFGNVNTAATRRDGSQVMREGKTKRDKANGHRPYVKNVRIWVAGSVAKGKAAGASGAWVKK